MKKEDMFRLLGDVDEQKVADAVHAAPAVRKVHLFRWGALAACLCLCVIGVFKFQHPGMGCTQQVRDFLEADGTLYFSTWEEGVYCWNPDMTKPQKLCDTGRISKTDSGLILYSTEEDTLWKIAHNKLTKIGKAGIRDTLENAALIGIYDDYAYWSGEQNDFSRGMQSSMIVKTPLAGGQAEKVVSVSDGLYPSCHMRGDFLYYHLEAFNGSEEKIYARNLITGEESLLAKFPRETAQMPQRIYFMDDAIIVVSHGKNSLDRMEYTGGEFVQLTNLIPATMAISEWDGDAYFVSDFRKNEPAEAPQSNDYYSEKLISVDMDTGKWTEIEGFALENGNGTVRYTITNLAMTEGGFYFQDPYAGVLYHNFASDTDVEIYRSK